MKILKGIGIFILSLIIIYIALGFFGPSDYKVVRSIKIDATADVVYDQTTKFTNWAAWSPWAAEDPEAKYTIEKDDQIVGAKMGWDGEISGKGSMTITELVANEKMVYELSFVEPWEMSSVGGFNYTVEDVMINLEWYDKGDIPFTQRPMMLFMDLEEMMGPQFEEGLKNIKEICETIKSKPTKLKDGFYLEIRNKGSKSGIKIMRETEKAMLIAVKEYEKVKDVVILGEFKNGKPLSKAKKKK